MRMLATMSWGITGDKVGWLEISQPCVYFDKVNLQQNPSLTLACRVHFAVPQKGRGNEPDTKQGETTVASEFLMILKMSEFLLLLKW